MGKSPEGLAWVLAQAALKGIYWGFISGQRITSQQFSFWEFPVRPELVEG
jgi:hypothetical protein